MRLTSHQYFSTQVTSLINTKYIHVHVQCIYKLKSHLCIILHQTSWQLYHDVYLILFDGVTETKRRIDAPPGARFLVGVIPLGTHFLNGLFSGGRGAGGREEGRESEMKGGRERVRKGGREGRREKG